LLQAARERFNEFMQMAALPADDADVERVRRERREAAAKDGVKFADADLPEKFYKLPRIRFLLLLCKEMLRINRWATCPLRFFVCVSAHLCTGQGPNRMMSACRYIVTFGEDRFTAMDVQRSGKIGVVAVRTFVKSMSPGVSDAQVRPVSLCTCSAADHHSLPGSSCHAVPQGRC
jgi:hypothetical protein